jgi:hypothetical protein
VGFPEISAAKMQFSNYPNPFKSETTFSFSDLKGSAVLEIINVQGQIVHSEKLPGGANSLTWNVNGLPNGVYFARLLSGNGELATLKLMLNLF